MLPLFPKPCPLFCPGPCFSSTFLFLILAVASCCYLKHLCNYILDNLLSVWLIFFFFTHPRLFQLIAWNLSNLEMDVCCVDEPGSGGHTPKYLKGWSLLLLLFLGTRTGPIPGADVCGGGRRTTSNSTHPVLLKTVQRPGPPSAGG